MKLLDKKREENFCCLGLVKDFFRHNTKIMITNRKINKLDLIKVKYSVSRDSVRRMRRKPTDFEKVFAKYRPNTSGLASKIYKEFSKIIRKQLNSAKDLNRHLTKEDILMANNLKKRCIASLVVREKHAKITMRYLYIFTRMYKL